MKVDGRGERDVRNGGGLNIFAFLLFLPKLLCSGKHRHFVILVGIQNQKPLRHIVFLPTRSAD